MIDLNGIEVIDFLTHAEETRNACRDDGYNEFQAGMAAYLFHPG